MLHTVVTANGFKDAKQLLKKEQKLGFVQGGKRKGKVQGSSSGCVVTSLLTALYSVRGGQKEEDDCFFYLSLEGKKNKSFS